MSAISYRDLWSDTVVHTVSPNGQIFVDNFADQRIEVRLDDGYFHRTGSDQVTQQLVRVLRLAIAERFRERRQLLRDVSEVSFEEPTRGRRPHADEVRRRSEELEAVGTSSDGRVEVTAIGLQHLALRMDPGLFLSGDRLLLEADLGEACTRAVQAQIAGMRDLKHRVADDLH